MNPNTDTDDEKDECGISGSRQCKAPYFKRYGSSVLCCKACSTFFKRHANDWTALVCYGDERCRRGSKGQCPKCRFERCIQAGMVYIHARVDRSSSPEPESSSGTRLHQPAADCLPGQSAQHSASEVINKLLSTLSVSPKALMVMVTNILQYLGITDQNSLLRRTNDILPYFAPFFESWRVQRMSSNQVALQSSGYASIDRTLKNLIQYFWTVPNAMPVGLMNEIESEREAVLIHSFLVIKALADQDHNHDAMIRGLWKDLMEKSKRFYVENNADFASKWKNIVTILMHCKSLAINCAKSQALTPGYIVKQDPNWSGCSGTPNIHNPHHHSPFL